MVVSLAMMMSTNSNEIALPYVLKCPKQYSIVQAIFWPHKKSKHITVHRAVHIRSCKKELITNKTTRTNDLQIISCRLCRHRHLSP